MMTEQYFIDGCYFRIFESGTAFKVVILYGSTQTTLGHFETAGGARGAILNYLDTH